MLVVPWHEAIRSDSVLEAEELPASIPYLDPSLTYMNAYDLSHDDNLIMMIW